jgi:hypothetical protein
MLLERYAKIVLVVAQEANQRARQQTISFHQEQPCAA